MLTLPLLVLGRGVLVGLLPGPLAVARRPSLVNAVYWPLVVVGLLLALTSFYHVMLPHRLPWRRHLPGAVFAVAFFLVAAPGAARLRRRHPHHGAALRRAGRPDRASCCSAFFFGMAVLLGAELNATIQARWPAPLRRHDRRRAQRAAGGQARVRGPQARARLRRA